MSSTFLTPFPLRPQATRSQTAYPTQPNIRPTPYPPTNPSRRPGAPRRAHSFCGDSSSSTYALASTSASSHLTPDKRQLIAPPLERTISSIGPRGNHSPPDQQMVRPKVVCTSVPDPGLRRLVQANLATPPCSPVPVILVHSTTPPRPILSSLHTPSSSTSRSSSYSVTPTSPDTPVTATLFGQVIPEEPREKGQVREGRIDDVVEGVGELTVE